MSETELSASISLSKPLHPPAHLFPDNNSKTEISQVLLDFPPSLHSQAVAMAANSNDNDYDAVHPRLR